MVYIFHDAFTIPRTRCLIESNLIGKTNRFLKISSKIPTFVKHGVKIESLICLTFD